MQKVEWQICHSTNNLGGTALGKTFLTSIKAFLLLTIAILVIGCSAETDTNKNPSHSDKGTPQQGGEVTVAYITDATNYDPILSSSADDNPILWPIYDTLISFTSELEPAPGLAESWEFLDDTTLELQLREGVTFHDGTAFDAEAVKFNIERSISEESQVSDLDSVEKAEVVDEKTVKIHLKQEDSSLLLALSDRAGMIVSPTAVKKSEKDFSQNPIGAGPFKLVNRVPNGEVVFEAYEDYWQEGQPYVDKLTIKIMADENTRINALKSGEIDLAVHISPGNAQSLENDVNVVLKDALPIRVRAIYLNTSMPPLDNQAVRLAVQHGIDREALIQGVNLGKGEVATQVFPKQYWAANKNMEIKYDPEKSKKLLKEAGHENVSFTLIQFAMAQEIKMAEAIKGQLAEVGIDVKLDSMEVNTGTASFFAEKKAPAFYSTWTGRPDPQITINQLFSKDSFYNPGGYSTSEIESLISKAASTYDQDERATLYKEINEKAILEEAMIIPIIFEPVVSAMNQQVQGFEPNMMGKPVFSSIWLDQ